MCEQKRVGGAGAPRSAATKASIADVHQLHHGPAPTGAEEDSNNNTRNSSTHHTNSYMKPSVSPETRKPLSSPIAKAASPSLSATLLICENANRSYSSTNSSSCGMATGEDPAENTTKHSSNNNKVAESGVAFAVAQDEQEEDEEDDMGACYPKCMNQEFDDGRILPGMRAKRPARKPAASKSKSNNDRQYAANPREQASECFDLEQIGYAMRMDTLDLEELGMEEYTGEGLDFEQPPPKSIVVDYEEAQDAAVPDAGSTSRRQRQNPTASDCAPDACRPMETMSAQNPAEELFELTTPSSTPLTPGRRRSSRKTSIGNSNDNNNTNSSSSSSLPTPRRGKSIIFEHEKVVPQEPISPSTETEGSEDGELRCSPVHKLCLCEVRLHKTKASCWLVANNQVYDVTGIMDVHPGGPRSILRKAGGPDCTQDMKFHTKKARKMLEKCFIGKLQPCGEDPEENTGANCSIM